MNGPGVRRATREVLLTTGAILGVVCILATIAGLAFGVKPLIFRSGSMSPAINTGDLAISRTVDASTLKRGDIVSVITSGGTRVTHRVVNVAVQGDARQLTLKGDTNKSPDAEVYTVTRADHVLFHVPKAGYVINAATSPIGVFILGIYVAMMLLLVFGRRDRDNGGDPPDPGRRRADRASRRTDQSRTAARSATVATIAGGLTVLSVVAASPTWATPWTDPVAVTGGNYTASTVPAPVVSCGALGIASVTINWTAVSGATGYLLHYGTGGATSQSVGSGVTSKVFSGVATSGVFTVEAQINYGSTTWSSAPSNAKNYTVVLLVLGVCS